MEKRYYIVKNLDRVKELNNRGFVCESSEKGYIFEDTKELREAMIELSELERKFYVVKSKNLAMGLKWLGFEYYVFDSKEHEGEQVYSFERNKRFDNAMKLLNKIKYE